MMAICGECELEDEHNVLMVMKGTIRYSCIDCGHEWEEDYDGELPETPEGHLVDYGTKEGFL